MAKLIFTSRYIRDAPPKHLQNYVRAETEDRESIGAIKNMRRDG